VRGVLAIVTRGFQQLKTDVLTSSPHGPPRVKIVALAMVKATLKARLGVCQQDLASSSDGELAKLAFVLVAEQAIERRRSTAGSAHFWM